MTVTDRSTPGVQIVRFASERATQAEPIDLRGRILSLRYEDHDQHADACTLELDNRDLALFDREDLAGGTILGVRWGYAGAMSPRRRVVVRRMKGFARLTLECHALSTLLDRVPRTRQFENRTASEVVREVARELGYDDAFTDIAETSDRIDALVQNGETDARFLSRLAARHGFVFRTDETSLVWRRARRAAEPSHVFTYYDTQRGDVLDVSVESDLGRRVGSVTVRGRDPRSRTTIEASATGESVARTTLGEVVEVVDPETGASALEQRTATSSLRTTTTETAGDAQTEADSRFRAAEERAVRLKVQVVGDPTLFSGRVIEMRNISRLLSGNYYVRTATHVVGGEAYTTELALRRDGVGRLARQLARTQGGTPNEEHAPTTDDESPASRTVEVVDAETGRSRIEYRDAESAS